MDHDSLTLNRKPACQGRSPVRCAQANHRMECAKMANASLLARLDRIVQAACEPVPDLQLLILAESVNRDHGIGFPFFSEMTWKESKTSSAPERVTESPLENSGVSREAP